MLINKVFGDDFLTNSEDEINFYSKKFLSQKSCKMLGEIKGIKYENIEGNIGPVYNINITINKNGIDSLIKSYGVTNFGNDGFAGQIPGLFIKNNGENYNPQLGDYLVAKINPENNYINDLYLMNDKSINEINSFYNDLDLPSCESIIKQETENNIVNNPQENYIIFGIIIILVFIIGIFIGKKLKFKK